jgi:hypothetical protein
MQTRPRSVGRPRSVVNSIPSYRQFESLTMMNGYFRCSRLPLGYRVSQGSMDCNTNRKTFTTKIFMQMDQGFLSGRMNVVSGCSSLP